MRRLFAPGGRGARGARATPACVAERFLLVQRCVTCGDSAAALREAVVLSLVLTRPALRGHLAGGRRRRDDADQRRVPGLAELAALLRDAPAPVASQLSGLRARAARLLDRGTSAGVRALPWTHAAYPRQLAAIDDPPAVLWVRGDPARLSAPAVAIVGSRTGSPYACAVAERLAAGLAEGGVAVISGLARGVDAAAHRGALSAGGPTVAVLGSGVDVVYPPEHASLAEEIVAHGVVASELGPGAPPLPYHFPRRNRILSGLSRAVVVVEATERSGSLITARLAAEQGREVMAVPGNVLSGRSRGAHRLIRDGARIVETAGDILEELGLLALTGGDEEPPTEADPVLARMDPGDPCDVERLAQQSGLALPALLTHLTELELQGRVARIGAGRFVRLPSPVVT